MLGSTNLCPLVFLVFCCNFVKRPPFATKFCTQCHRQREQMLQIWWLYDFYFFVCAYILAKLYVGMYGLATIYVHTRK